MTSILLENYLLIFTLCVRWVTTCMSVYNMYAWYSWRPEEGILSPRTGITGNQEPPDIGAVSWICVLQKQEMLLTIESSLQFWSASPHTHTSFCCLFITSIFYIWSASHVTSENKEEGIFRPSFSSLPPNPTLVLFPALIKLSTVVFSSSLPHFLEDQEDPGTQETLLEPLRHFAFFLLAHS